MFISVFTLIFFGATFIWQEARIEQARISDINYHYILMNGGVNSEGLDTKAGSATRSASSKSKMR